MTGGGARLVSRLIRHLGPRRGGAIRFVGAQFRAGEVSAEAATAWVNEVVDWMASGGLAPAAFSTLGAAGYREAQIYRFGRRRLPPPRADGNAGFTMLAIDSASPVRRGATLQIAESPVAVSVSSWCWADGEDVDPIDRLSAARRAGMLDYGFADSARTMSAARVHAGLTPLFSASPDGLTLGTIDGARERIPPSGRVLDLLGDVHPMQVLGPPHLLAPIGGQPLGDWIGAEAGRGQLVPFGHGLALWTILPDAIENIRATLAAAGLLTRRSADGCLASWRGMG